MVSVCQISRNSAHWPRYNQWQPYGIGAADLIQVAANVATVVCPEGPRIRTFIGRVDDPTEPPGGLLPDVNGNVEEIIRLFEDKTIRLNGLVALVGAHTTSQQRFVNPQRAFDPQDSTPGVWDVLVYSQVANLEATPKRVMKFASDIKLANHPRGRNAWMAFASPQGGQQRWNDVRFTLQRSIKLTRLGIRKRVRPYEHAWCQ
jgi:manganese peroxidase